MLPTSRTGAVPSPRKGSNRSDPRADEAAKGPRRILTSILRGTPACSARLRGQDAGHGTVPRYHLSLFAAKVPAAQSFAADGASEASLVCFVVRNQKKR